MLGRKTEKYFVNEQNIGNTQIILLQDVVTIEELIRVATNFSGCEELLVSIKLET